MISLETAIWAATGAVSWTLFIRGCAVGEDGYIAFTLRILIGFVAFVNLAGLVETVL